MKHIVRNPYHLWAHQSQDWAANSGRTCKFEEDSAYSYQAEIGRIVTNSRGERAYLVCGCTYSVTTSRHQSDLRRSIPSGERVFTVEQLSQYVNAERESARYLHDIVNLTAKSRRARVYGHIHLARAGKLMQELRQFAEFFDLELNLNQDFDELADELIQAQRKAEEERKRARVEARKRAAEDIARWQAGEPIQCPYLDGEQFLRLKDCDTVETSLRAEVPLSHVLRALPTVLRIIESGDGFNPHGSIRLGHYSLTAISPAGTVHVGCHKFLKAEILRFAEVLHGLKLEVSA